MAFKHIIHQFLCLTWFLVSATSFLPTSRDSSHPIDPDQLSMSERHEQWMARHGRIYKDEAEKAARLTIFKDNIQRIEAFNNENKKNGYKYTLGVNRFTDLTKEEFVAKHTGYVTKPAPSNLSAAFQETTSSAIVNKMFLSEDALSFVLDWREKDAVTGVKDQGACASAWAFAAVAALQSMNKIAGGDLISLSEQELVDCVSDNYGCNGGFMENAFQYVEENGGITDEASYPFYGTEGNTCRGQSVRKIVRIRGFQSVDFIDEDVLLQAVAEQPVAVGINADHMSDYASGVFNGPCNTSINHAMTLVGYGTTEDGTDYWLAKNSWGKIWGEDGYIRIERNSGVVGGMCGLARMAVLDEKCTKHSNVL